MGRTNGFAQQHMRSLLYTQCVNVPWASRQSCQHQLGRSFPVSPWEAIHICHKTVGVLWCVPSRTKGKVGFWGQGQFFIPVSLQFSRNQSSALCSLCSCEGWAPTTPSFSCCLPWPRWHLDQTSSKKPLLTQITAANTVIQEEPTYNF